MTVHQITEIASSFTNFKLYDSRFILLQEARHWAFLETWGNIKVDFIKATGANELTIVLQEEQTNV